MCLIYQRDFRSRFSRERQVRVLSVSIYFAGPSIGPLIGGFIAELLHWRFIFVVLAVSSVVMTILTPFVLPETLDRTKASGLSHRESFETWR